MLLLLLSTVRREPIGVSSAYTVSGSSVVKSESLKDQVKGFAMARGEIVVELGSGCKDIVQQSLRSEDSYVGRTLQKPCVKVFGRLKYLNEFLLEDHDPAHSWPVIFFVFVLALAGDLNFKCIMLRIRVFDWLIKFRCFLSLVQCSVVLIIEICM